MVGILTTEQRLAALEERSDKHGEAIVDLAKAVHTLTDLFKSEKECAAMVVSDLVKAFDDKEGATCDHS